MKRAFLKAYLVFFIICIVVWAITLVLGCITYLPFFAIALGLSVHLVVLVADIIYIMCSSHCASGPIFAWFIFAKVLKYAIMTVVVVLIFVYMREYLHAFFLFFLIGFFIGFIVWNGIFIRIKPWIA